MKTLRLGSKGDEVGKWQYFLRGAGLYFGEVDEVFGEATREGTQSFQRRHGLLEDGIAGNRTLGEAMRVGFSATEEDAGAESPLEFPPPPSFGPLGQAGRQQRFGKYDFVAAPVDGNPEAIQIHGGWVAENIQMFTIPQLKNVSGAAAEGRAQFHREVGPRVLELFQRWEEAGHLGSILTYGGSFVPRFVRGSRSVLSPHAHGSAFDINVAWNGFGAVPAKLGGRGSVRALVPIANELGFYWGGHFKRRDGMHFELAR
ncbi:MAG: peptidoglycan-binding protein [Myxococcales bacterium]|nr:MAG: peptidoglycan-binding protein [Myxococcales bacterium]